MIRNCSAWNRSSVLWAALTFAPMAALAQGPPLPGEPPPEQTKPENPDPFLQDALQKDALQKDSLQQDALQQDEADKTSPNPLQDARDRVYYPGDTERFKPLMQKLLGNVLLDQKAAWTSPFRMHSEDVKWWVGFGAATAALIATDKNAAL